MHQINEIFAVVESLRLISDAEPMLREHASRDAYVWAMGYMCDLLADRLEDIAQDMDNQKWRPTLGNIQKIKE